MTRLKIITRGEAAHTHLQLKWSEHDYFQAPAYVRRWVVGVKRHPMLLNRLEFWIDAASYTVCCDENLSVSHDQYRALAKLDLESGAVKALLLARVRPTEIIELLSKPC